jgi:hypothetical protein
LRAAPRAPMILGLTGFLLAGTEWHGTPQSNIKLGLLGMEPVVARSRIFTHSASVAGIEI